MVRSLSERVSAMARLERPAATWRRTSTSREVRPLGADGASPLVRWRRGGPILAAGRGIALARLTASSIDIARPLAHADAKESSPMSARAASRAVAVGLLARVGHGGQPLVEPFD